MHGGGTTAIHVVRQQFTNTVQDVRQQLLAPAAGHYVGRLACPIGRVKGLEGKEEFTRTASLLSRDSNSLTRRKLWLAARGSKHLLPETLLS
jgi:hypothetical protein